MARILLVEDDAALCRGIILALKDNARAFVTCPNLQDAEKAFKSGNFDLVILDINLPDGSGLDLCQTIRDKEATPILFLTANDTELDIVTGLESGADDYITKPFSLAVLRARVNALLRRGSIPSTSLVAIDNFCFDFEKMRFLKNGENIEMSKTEQRLLRLLVSHRGQVLTRAMLLEKVWPDGSAFVDENALSVTVSRIRAKLEADPSAPRYIKTIYGIGYTWAADL